MSCVIHIWQNPVPRTFDEAQSFVFETERTKPGQNHLFIEFAKKLVSKYPSSDDLEIPDDSIWTDEPLDGNCSEDIYAIGVKAQHWKDALPFIVSSANSLGLSVYDMQAGRAFTPPANVLEPLSKPFKPKNRRYKAIALAATGVGVITFSLIAALGRSSSNGNVWGPGGAPPILMPLLVASAIVAFWTHVRSKK